VLWAQHNTNNIFTWLETTQRSVPSKRKKYDTLHWHTNCDWSPDQPTHNAIPEDEQTREALRQPPFNGYERATTEHKQQKNNHMYIPRHLYFFMVVCCWRFVTTMVLQRHDWVGTISGFISLGLLFLCSGYVPCSYSTHLAPGKKAIQYQFTRFWWDPGDNSRPTSTEADALTTRPWTDSTTYRF